MRTAFSWIDYLGIYIYIYDTAALAWIEHEYIQIEVIVRNDAESVMSSSRALAARLDSLRDLSS